MQSTPQPPAHRATWIDAEGVAWRVELIAGRWSLSGTSRPPSNGSVSTATRNRQAAISAAYGQDGDQDA
jgi:hypothetical protein